MVDRNITHCLNYLQIRSKWNYKTMDKASFLKCIYCPSTGPFSDEHVFPAGMGGDDKNFLLIDSVCKNCNTGIFSKLELSLMRRSPTGLGRQFMQTKTRDKGSRTSRPKIETKSHFILDESGRFLEAEYDNNGAEVVLAQCIIEGKKIFYTAHDAHNLKKLYSELSKALETPTTDLIIKRKDDAISYQVITYEWKNDEYRLISDSVFPKPPTTGIWLEISPKKQPAASPRFYQRLTGQLNLRTGPEADHAPLLRSMRRTLPSMKSKQGEATLCSIDQPIIQIEMIIDIDGTERALAKIGVNFLAHTFGKNFIARPEFESIKKSILTGVPELPFSSFGDESEDLLIELFGSVPKHCHCAMLIGIPSESGSCDIYFNVKLYNTVAHKVLLAKSLPLTDLFTPIYFLINYEDNIIKKMSMLEYQSIHGVLVERFLNQNNSPR